MQLPAISGIRTEDFPSEQKWIAKLLQPLNQFLLSATNAINGNITYTDNIPCQLIKMNFTYRTTADFPMIIKWNIAQNNSNASLTPPTEVRVCSATENGTAIAIVPAWNYSNGIINFTYFTKLTSSGVTGLTAGSKYNIILRGQP